MFKLIKILNSGNNVPEPVRVPVMVSSTIPAGSLLFLHPDGYLEEGFEETRPKYITIETTDESSYHAICYRVTDDMVFEAPLANADTAAFGSPLHFHGDGGVTPTGDPSQAIATLCGNYTTMSGDMAILRFIK